MEKQNTSKDLMAYFGENKKVSVPEFSAFWKSLSDEDKQYYRTVDLASC